MTGAANDNSGGHSPTALKRACPICGKPAVVDFKPFCSKRCADVDLHRWLGEGYRVPVEAEDDDARDSPDGG